jgi:uncharacterized paraquat-inducible protein A
MVSEKSLIFRGRLSRLAVRCPDCQQAWLAPGLSAGDECVCKNCGAAFVNTGTEASRQPRNLPRPLTPPDAVETPA